MQNRCQDIYPYQSLVGADDRHRLYRHKGGLLWIYGLSASGKSTLAHAVEWTLHCRGVHSFVLDGDNVRTRLNRDLGLSDADRRENNRRVAEVGRLMVEAGLLVMAAFITPFEETRRQVREVMADMPYFECYLRCPLGVCESRDPKGLYKRARAGEIKNLTGLGAPFEEPTRPDLVVETGALDLAASVERVIGFLVDQGMIGDPPPAAATR